MTATITNKPKSATSVISNRAKNVAITNTRPKAGQSYFFDEENYTFDEVSSDVGVVYFDQVGTSVSVTNKPKN